MTMLAGTKQEEGDRQGQEQDLQTDVDSQSTNEEDEGQATCTKPL